MTQTATVDVRVQRRKLYINISRRKLRTGQGSSRAFLSRRTTDMIWTDLTAILTPIHYAVVGGVATRLYMPERFTKDIDVIVAASTASLVRAKLTQAGLQYQADLSLVRGSTWLAPNGQEIDVLEGAETWWPEALAEAQTNLDGQGLPVVPLRYLVLMKYQSGRAQDLADIERMLGQSSESQLGAIRTLFQRQLPNDVEDLESLIELGKLSS